MRHLQTGLIFSLLAALCVMPVSAAKSPAGISVKAPQWPEKVVFGIVPTEGGADIVERSQPLVKHLEEVLGIDVEPVSATDYAGVITAMSHGHVDFAYFGPKSYVEAADRCGAVAIAMELSPDGNPGYHGIIIARKDSGHETMEDVKGLTFAFTDPNSTSGYLVPLILFARDLKVDPAKYFKEVKFSGSHAASILSVKNGTIDAAATNDIDLGRLVQSGQVRQEDFVVLWTSELIPGAPIAVSKDMPLSLKAALIGAFVMFTDDASGTKQLGNGGYIPATDKEYDVIRYLERLRDDMKQSK